MKRSTPISRVTAFALACAVPLSLLALLGSLTGCSSGEAAAAEDIVGSEAFNLSKTFAVVPGGRLVIDADRGAIELATGDDDTLEVKVLREVRRTSEKKATQIVQAHHVTFAQEDGVVVVRARLEKGIRSWARWGSGLQVRYLVRLPKRFDVDLKTSGGSIRVPERIGRVLAATSGGNLYLGFMDGPVSCRTSGGDVEVRNVSQALEARTSGGSIEIGVAMAEARLSTSGGRIRVDEARGPLDAGTSGGSIRIKQAYATVNAETSGGSIDVGLASTFHGDCLLSTSGGNVDVTIPERTNALLDARTSGGSVHSDLPVTVQGEFKRSAIVGKLGEGGRLIKLRTSGGNIHVVKG